MEHILHIVQGCIAFDQKCQRQLYERYYGYSLKVVFRYIYRYEKAVDVVNDGFVKLFRNFNKFECKEPDALEKILMGWIRRIMINTAIDELRRHNMMPEIGPLPEHVWNDPDNSGNADQKILYKELVAQVKKLPPAYRTVFNLFVIDGYTHQEIAAMLGISVGTSKSNLAKARAHLQKFINNDKQEADSYAAIE
ncbi:RNA polymerase sigma factor [Foetidibacter luteolus]|uniref:RNA polymerase sigma factor n=1 Tax=Foetidibacter luteolus TaxID=2608880 RepID=UPI00129A8AF8|nr:sigma-70 family RNA polymerase sigma factor [Foetidibacter luteolus]